MPTTQPLDPGDDAEGQLKPIAAFSTAPQTPEKPASSAAAIAPQTQPPMQSAGERHALSAGAPTAAAGTVSAHTMPTGNAASRRTSLGAPRLSLSRQRNEAPQAAAPTQSHPQATASYTPAQFTAAWTAYIEAHTTHRILVNTMRASIPAHVKDHRYVMTVENDIQVETLHGAMADILAYMHSTLGNDLIEIDVRSNSGEISPATWNEREVVADMARRHPGLSHFIKELDLKFN